MRQKWVCLQILLLVIVLLLIHWLPLKIVEITDSVLGNKPLLLQVSYYFLEVKILVSQAVNLLMQVINRRLILSWNLFEMACLILVELCHALFISWLHDLHLCPDLFEFTRLLLEPIFELSNLVSTVLHIFVFHAYLCSKFPNLLLILRLNLLGSIVSFIAVLFVSKFQILHLRLKFRKTWVYLR